MILATECRCERQLVFEAGICFRCGRLLEPAVASGEHLDWPINLEAAIERERLKLPEQAREVGVDPEDKRLYAAWLDYMRKQI